MLAYGVMLAVVLTRVGLLQFKWSAIWDFADDFKLNNSYGKTVLRDMRSDKTKAQEVTKMSFILSLVFGPFFIMIIIMTCLVAVMFGLTRDPFGMPLQRDFLETQRDQDADFACSSPIGYFGTISGVSANILKEGYVFMFVGANNSASRIVGQ
jgi:hypothetical protein